MCSRGLLLYWVVKMSSNRIPDPRFLELTGKLESVGFVYKQCQKPRGSKVKQELTFTHERLLERFRSHGLYTQTKTFYLIPLDEEPDSPIGFSVIKTSPLHTENNLFPAPNHNDKWLNTDEYPAVDLLLSAIAEFLTPDMNEVQTRFFDQVVKAMGENSEERLKRLKEAAKKPERIKTSVWSYQRNPDVVAEVLLRAEGRCERCNNNAPFLRKKDQTPYLEVHHKQPLSDGGDDTVENAIALCPNCHRHQHFGQ